MITNTPYVSLILPCFNEEAILEKNIGTVIEYLNKSNYRDEWEIVIINDGSKDKTAQIAKKISSENKQIHVFHHPVNLNLGHALQTGFANASGEILVVLDIDLSYAPEHIGLMVETLKTTYADMVIASPYMKGGKVTAVPFIRKIMSKWVNRFMRMASQEKFHTFTGMVRAYRRDFIQSLNLKTKDYEINPEIMYKAMILRARIVEVPAHLDWTEQNKFKETRTSGIRVLRGVFSGMMSGFIFRPYIFFIGIGAFLMLLSMYQIIWLFIDTVLDISLFTELASPFSESLKLQFTKNPQSFIVGGITLLASLQFLGLGFISLQSKRYYEEIFHLGTTVRKWVKKD
ncbi:glycosyltransferase family 2 protein [Saccharicrinis sp. FJH62]|uniref:glycosyltransferase family 2 protein n=1 Tax=Saccharicrinis sp. FJH62 TaxID=3344657 RepID=UPI0035D521ED